MGHPGIEVSESAKARLVTRFGPSARVWLQELNHLVDEVSVAWGVRPVHLLPAGGTSVVMCCRSEQGTTVVVKLTPDPVVAAHESAGLSAWADCAHVVRLLDADLQRGALLLEHLPDAPSLAHADWSILDVLPLLVELRAVDSRDGAGLPTLTERVGFVMDLTERRAQHLSAGSMGAHVLRQARAGALELAAGGPVGLVHGDLHPGNVLQAGGRRGVVAIDPRPCWGDPAYDLIDWSLAGVATVSELGQRIDQLAAQVPGLDPDRLWGWCRALAAVLAVSALSRGVDDSRTRFLLTLHDDA